MQSIAVLAFAMVVMGTDSLSAQPIRGNPQKAEYADPTEWPTLSNQCHWTAPGVGLLPGMPAHTHMDLKFPVQGEVELEPITARFTVTLFHTNGKVTALRGSLVKSWTLDNGAELPLVGDVNGVKVWTGTVTFDPALGTVRRVPRHGFYPLHFDAVTRYDNGDTMSNSLRLSVFSVIDTSAVEAKHGDGTGIRTQSTCTIANPKIPDIINRWGRNIVYFKQTLPILGTLSPETPWELGIGSYNYAPKKDLLPPGTLEVILNPDLHNSNPGTSVARFQGFNIRPFLSFPGNLPEGAQKVMVAWRRPTLDGLRDLTTILVLPLHIGPDGSEQPPDTWPSTPTP
jgi:hypothetical protein